MTREGLAELWRERLDDYAESGGTVHEWCRFNSVSERRVRRAALPPPPPLILSMSRIYYT